MHETPLLNCITPSGDLIRMTISSYLEVQGGAHCLFCVVNMWCCAIVMCGELVMVFFGWL